LPGYWVASLIVIPRGFKCDRDKEVDWSSKPTMHHQIVKPSSSRPLRRRWLASLIALLAMVTLVGMGAKSYGVASEGTSFENRPGPEFCKKNRAWMKSLPDSTPLSAMALPGTHDTCATRNGISLGFAKCQSWKLEDQLRAGIRFLDIRCKHLEDEFHIYHGSIDQKMTFREVMQVCRDFLKSCPSECIVMSVKEEGAGRGNRRSFKETFDAETEASRALLVLGSDIPLLGQVRGKIVLVDRVGSLKGFPWDGLVKQDDYQAEIEKKKNLIRDTYTKAVQDRGQKWFINYCSGTLPSELITPKKYAVQTNVVALELLKTDASKGRACGILVYDFPSEALIQATIDANARESAKLDDSQSPKDR
jgi:hypothetical protein